VITGEKRAFHFLWLVLLAVCSLIRFYDLSRFSLWLDEYTSIEVATKSLGAIITGEGFDRATPPFYYVLLHLWFKLFTPSEFWLRLPSAVFDLASIWLLFRFLKGRFADEVVRLATLIYASSPFAIYFAQEGRMYSLLTMLCLLTLNLLSAKSVMSLGALSLVAVSGLYTHYYYGFFLIGVSVYLLAVKNLRASASLFVAGLAFLPWVGVLLSLASSGGQSFRPLSLQALPYLFFRFLAGYAVFPLDSVTKADTAVALRESWPMLGLVTATSSLLIAAGVWKLKEHRALILLPILSSALLPLLISLKIPMFSERYLAGVYPLFALLYAVGALFLSRLLPRCITLLLIGTLAFGNYSYFGGESRFGKEQWREAGAYLSGREVFIDPPYTAELLRFYCAECSIRALDQWDGREGALLVRRGRGVIPDPKGAVLERNVVFPHESGIFVYILKRQ
jgi:uncharacterized membrane protein